MHAAKIRHQFCCKLVWCLSMASSFAFGFWFQGKPWSTNDSVFVLTPCPVSMLLCMSVCLPYCLLALIFCLSYRFVYLSVSGTRPLIQTPFSRITTRIAPRQARLVKVQPALLLAWIYFIHLYIFFRPRQHPCNMCEARSIAILPFSTQLLTRSGTVDRTGYSQQPTAKYRAASQDRQRTYYQIMAIPGLLGMARHGSRKAIISHLLCLPMSSPKTKHCSTDRQSESAPTMMTSSPWYCVSSLLISCSPHGELLCRPAEYNITPRLILVAHGGGGGGSRKVEMCRNDEINGDKSGQGDR